MTRCGDLKLSGGCVRFAGFETPKVGHENGVTKSQCDAQRKFGAHTFVSKDFFFIQSKFRGFLATFEANIINKPQFLSGFGS